MDRRIIKILIVDERYFRSYLRTALSEIDGVQIIGEAENGQDAIQRVGKLIPEIVIMDIQIPVLDGIQATQKIKQFP